MVVDDQTLVRAGLRMILDAQPDMEVVGEAADGQEAIELVRRLGPDVVLMDIRMPGMDGIEATRRLVGQPGAAPPSPSGPSGVPFSRQPVRVVMLTTYDLDEYVFDALAAGASGFLLKHVPPEELALGVRAAPGVDRAALRSAIQRVVAPWPALRVDDAASYKRTVTDTTTRALGLIAALLGLAVVIAFLGTVNTLALSVFERTREPGLLRAVGMTRSQLATTVRWEALLVALLVALTGVLLGVALGAAIADSITHHVLGATTIAVPALRLLASVALAAVAAILAAVSPARRAAHLDVLTAIGVE